MRAVARAGLTGVHHAGSDRRWVVADVDQKRNNDAEPPRAAARADPRFSGLIRRDWL
jgi:hypothetical protein